MGNDHGHRPKYTRARAWSLHHALESGESLLPVLQGGPVGISGGLGGLRNETPARSVGGTGCQDDVQEGRLLD